MSYIIFRSYNLPTQSQCYTAIFVCQLLSNLYQPIQVFRYDQKLKTIYIQAGIRDEIALIIKEDGNWDFVL
ncbi:DUF6888 family protein [Floridanema evergladense]|uniref:DUF6888 domain-containing protein n=1 Tax=Floridaenema evergladense BLCC-F167 TaxID=3153639 RepID=A0ABV4WT97_9CYAN